VSRKRSELPEFDPLAGEGESTSSLFAEVHVPISGGDDLTAETMVVAEYRLDQIIPDYFQSRGGVMPREISIQVQQGKIEPAQALETWQALAKEDPAQGRRYTLLEKLAASIRSNGLINAIHIAETDELKSYLILAGERRYWAFWLLEGRYGGYDRIPAILHRDPLRFLQIAENEDVEPLSTVSRARQVALAYLELLGIRPPAQFMENEHEYWGYYRQALMDPEELIGASYRPRGLWSEMQERLSMSRPSMLRLMSILTLPDGGLERADRWDLGQRQLLSILKAPQRYQEELVDLAIEHSLAGNSLSRLVKLTKADGDRAYQEALARLRGERPETAQKALRRPPLEKHALRLLSGLKGIEKEAKGDYAQLARLMVGNQPDSAIEMARTLERTARAIRDELRAKAKEEEKAQAP